MRATLAAALRAPWLRDPLWTRARMAPSLDLDFAGTGSLRDRVSGQSLVTFTRASDGTYVDSQGIIRTATTDVPRITHDPTTGRCLGLLVEEARTNLLTWSEEADNPAWNIIFSGGAQGVTVDPDVVTAPDGKQTADKIKEVAADGSHTIQFPDYPFQDGVTYVCSFFVKAAERSRIRLVFPIAFTDRIAFFDCDPNSYQVISDGGTIASITPVGNGWFRVSAVSTATTNSTGSRVSVSLVDTETNVSYLGDGTSGVYLWGAQLEVGTFPTSYIKTEDSTATRAADIATMLSGLDLNSIRGMYAEFINPASDVRGIASLNDNTANERIALNTSGTDPLLAVVDGGVTQANIDAGSFTANTRTRLAARFNTNDFAVSVNGGAEVVDTSGTMPTVDRLMIGRSQAGEYLNGPLARLVLFDRPPFNLQELTR